MDVRINQSVRRRRAHETYLTQPNPKKEDTRDCPYLLGFVVCPLFVWRGLFGLCKTAKELSLKAQNISTQENETLSSSPQEVFFQQRVSCVHLALKVPLQVTASTLSEPQTQAFYRRLVGSAYEVTLSPSHTFFSIIKDVRWDAE
tara:strand:+ start:163 stop:597 length:435 start_codon:yes stop_codon:yes gene_type:complete